MNNLRIYGLPEVEDEDTTTVVQEFCRNKLNLELKASEIDISHRLKRKESGIKPILVRFVSRTSKKRVFNNKSKLKGSKIVIKEDLCPEKLALLKKVTESVPYRSAWTSDGKIFVKVRNKIHSIKTTEDVQLLRQEQPTE